MFATSAAEPCEVSDLSDDSEDSEDSDYDSYDSSDYSNVFNPYYGEIARSFLEREFAERTKNYKMLRDSSDEEKVLRKKAYQIYSNAVTSKFDQGSGIIDSEVIGFRSTKRSCLHAVFPNVCTNHIKAELDKEFMVAWGKVESKGKGLVPRSRE